MALSTWKLSLEVVTQELSYWTDVKGDNVAVDGAEILFPRRGKTLNKNKQNV